MSALLTNNAPEVSLTAATAVAARTRLAQHPAHLPLAESARLMPVTASPCPLRRAPQPAWSPATRRPQGLEIRVRGRPRRHPCPSLAEPADVRYLPQQGGNSRATADIELCCNLGGALPQPAAPT